MLDDTAAAPERRYFALLRGETPVARLKKAVSLSRTVRQLALAGLRERHPQAGGAELRVRLAVILYGRSFAERIFRDVPEDAR